MTTGPTATDGVREKALFDYRKKLLEHKEVESRLKESMIISCFELLFIFALHILNSPLKSVKKSKS